MAKAKATTEQTADIAVRFKSNNDVAIHVSDLGKAEEFYGNVLGFKLISRSDDHLAYDTGTFRLWINPDRKPQSFVPSFSVPDFAAAQRHLEAHGCKLVSPDKPSYFKDPFGFVFDVIKGK